jgi:thiamine biosynthesis lipoprotein
VIVLALGVAALAMGCAGPPPGGGETPTPAAGFARHAFRRPAMGGETLLVVYTAQRTDAVLGAERVFARLAELDRTMSDYRADSDLRRLEQTPPEVWVSVSDDLYRVLDAAQTMAEQTGGAFDVTVGPVVRLWRRANRTGQLPDAAELAAARARVGHDAIELDRTMRRVRLMRAGVQLDLGGIGKGFAADEAIAVLRQQGITRCMVDLGGDIALGDPPPGRAGWRVAVDAMTGLEEAGVPVLTLRNTAIATSGDAFRSVAIDGARYSHIVDPATGLGLTVRRAVTVVAPSGTTADALASALSVLGAEPGFALLEAYPRSAARIEEVADGRRGVVQSDGFPEAE